MKLTEIKRYSNRLRAGIVPYKGNKALFMISSDEAYGGSDPSIAKGGVDDSESVISAAIREGEEELGLKKSNMVAAPQKVWEGQLEGLKNTYDIHVFAVEVKDEDDFNTPHYETKETVWMTREDFMKNGRETHRAIADVVFDHMSRKK